MHLPPSLRYELVYTPPPPTPLFGLSVPLRGGSVRVPCSSSSSLLPSSFDRVIAPSRGNFCSRSLPSLSPFPVGEKEALRIPLERLPLIQLAPRLRGGRRKHLRDLYPPESGRRTRGCARESGRPRPSVGRSLRRDRRSRSPQRARWQRRHSQCFLARDPLARGTRLCWDIGKNGRKPSKISTSIKASLSNTTMMKT